MKQMFTLLTVVTLALTMNVNAFAADQRIELGLSAGTSHAVSGETFKDATQTGDAQNFWLGYGFDKSIGLELGFDHFDFDKADFKHQAIYLAGTYRFNSENWIHPIAKLGLGSYETKNSLDEKTTSLGAKAAAGLEADFKYASVGALLNYHFITKAGDADSLKNISALVPALFVTFHNAVEYESKSTSVAPVATSAPVAAAPVSKDTDADGINDEDDKCPSTQTGVVVNKFGCSEKEKASVKIEIEFASGKADLDEKYLPEVETLANFMKKFPETKVQIGGYTDNKGSVKRNTDLSAKRADSVKNALVKMGVEASRLTAKGFGPAKPVADNKTETGRAQNRRVMAEITVTTEKKK